MIKKKNILNDDVEKTLQELDPPKKEEKKAIVKQPFFKRPVSIQYSCPICKKVVKVDNVQFFAREVLCSDDQGTMSYKVI